MSSPLWHVGNQQIPFTDRTRIMGVVNVTPDSFSDGGAYLDTESAVQHGLLLARQGADFLDIGGESTRPGSEPVSEEEETRRVLPVLERLRQELPGHLLSIDTSKAGVAEKAIAAGADLVNDVTAGLGDPEIMPLVASSRAGYALMHMQGKPKIMQKRPVYRDVVDEVHAFLKSRIDAALATGISRERLAVDPGIGFGKTLEHNLALLAGLRQLQDLGVPLLLGVSKKRWIGDLTGRPVEERLAGSLAGAAVCIERGAHILRVHDVAETVDLVRILDRVRHSEKS